MDGNLSKNESARVDKILQRWTTILGLSQWSIALVVAEDYNNKTDVAASVDADWPYMRAKIRLRRSALEDINNDALSFALLHELCHCLLNAMEKDVEHDVKERTCETVALAIWNAWYAKTVRGRVEYTGPAIFR